MTTIGRKAKPTLRFVSYNPAGSRTLLLLPGTFSSHHEFDHLTFVFWGRDEYRDYHLLLPDLPRHGMSADLDVPFNLPSIAMLLSDLILEHACNGIVDVFGGDLGGYAALYLASEYPDLVSSVIVTGCERNYASNRYSTWTAIKTYLGAVLGMRLIPSSWLRRLMKKLDSCLPDELGLDMKKALSWRYVHGVFKMLHRDWGTGQDICQNIVARTLFLAAGRQDNIEMARERGQWLRKGQKDEEEPSKAAVVHGARHAWTLQEGKIDVLARGIVAWIENRRLPDEFEILEGVDEHDEKKSHHFD